jgi:hypothetical protein
MDSMTSMSSSLIDESLQCFSRVQRDPDELNYSRNSATILHAGEIKG